MSDVLDEFEAWEEEIAEGRALEDKVAELQMAARIDAAQEGD